MPVDYRSCEQAEQQPRQALQKQSQGDEGGVMGPGCHEFGRWKLTISDDLVARSPDGSHLIGSTVTMPQSFRNLTEGLGLSVQDALTLLEVNPRIALDKALRKLR